MFVIALGASVSACIYFWLASDMHVAWKLAASLAVAFAVACHFRPLGESVHFLVPTLIEVFVGIWGVLAIKLDLAGL